ncbi:MAG TPA: hypothetical protein PLJ65_12465, partial [Casimicrobium sp.]|nr:hypothetical protein [Casimicrobium sp.]
MIFSLFAVLDGAYATSNDHSLLSDTHPRPAATTTSDQNRIGENSRVMVGRFKVNPSLYASNANIKPPAAHVPYKIPSASFSVNGLAYSKELPIIAANIAAKIRIARTSGMSSYIISIATATASPPPIQS